MPLLVIALIVVPLLELWVILQVGGWLGVGPTIALLLVMSLLGAALLGSQGRLAWRQFVLALGERRVPAREIADGAIVVFGGALLLTPGFLTDFVGLACLLPPSRAVIRRLLTRTLFGRVKIASVAGGAWQRAREPGRGAGPGAAGASRDYDYEGSAREVTDSEPLPAAERPSSEQTPPDQPPQER